MFKTGLVFQTGLPKELCKKLEAELVLHYVAKNETCFKQGFHIVLISNRFAQTDRFGPIPRQTGSGVKPVQGRKADRWIQTGLTRCNRGRFDPAATKHFLIANFALQILHLANLK